ncbi:MAG: hypothetical protein VYA67_22120 [Actinomycetota bacterium]|nr:hypothetical protein [Actinomycetota bacterium]
MIVVGLDLSMTSAGIAILRNGRPVHLGTEGVKGGIKSWHHRRQRITDQAARVTDRILNTIGYPDYGAIEAPLTFGNEHSADSYDRYTLAMTVSSILDSWGCPHQMVHNQTRARWATGKGDASTKDLTAKQRKARVTAAVRTTWKPWRAHILNDDIADALTLAEICARHVRDELHFPIRRYQAETLTKLDWPSIPCTKPEHPQVGAPR